MRINSTCSIYDAIFHTYQFCWPTKLSVMPASTTTAIETTTLSTIIMLTGLLQKQFDFHYRNGTNIDELRQQQSRHWILGRTEQIRVVSGPKGYSFSLPHFVRKESQVVGEAGQLRCRAHTWQMQVQLHCQLSFVVVRCRRCHHH